VRFASFSVSAFPAPSVRLKGLQVAEDPRFGTQPFLTVAEGRVGIKLRPLLTGRVELSGLTLEKLRLEVIEDGGRLNIASLGASTSGARPAPRAPGAAAPAAGAAAVIAQVRIKDGVIHYVRRGPSATDLSLEGVEVTVRPSGETLILAGAAQLAPGGVRLKLSDAALALGAGRPLGEAPLRGVVDVDGRDVGPLAHSFIASPRVAGSVAGRLQLGGTLTQPTAQGELTFARLLLSERRPRCPPPVDRQLKLDGIHVPIAFKLSQLDSAPLTAQAAGGRLSARLFTALTGATRPVTIKDVEVKGVEMGPVLVDYLCSGFAATGPLDLTGDFTLQAGEPMRTLNGAGRLRLGRGRVVGSEALGLLRDILAVAGAVGALVEPGKLGAAPLRPLDFESVTASFRIVNGVVTTNDLDYQGQGLSASAAGSYGLADGRTEMAVTLTQGRNQIKTRVTGAVGGKLVAVPTGATLGGRDAVKQILDRLLR
jgi:AsmA protein